MLCNASLFSPVDAESLFVHRPMNDSLNVVVDKCMNDDFAGMRGCYS